MSGIFDNKRNKCKLKYVSQHRKAIKFVLGTLFQIRTTKYRMKLIKRKTS